MKKNAFIEVLVIAVAVLISANTFASTGPDKNGLLKIRAAGHTGFYRIVFEGSRPLISKGSVELKGNRVVVSFNGRNFRIDDTSTVKHTRDNGHLVFVKENINDMKYFFLNKPERFVVDLYTDPQKVQKHKEQEPNKASSPNITKKEKPALKQEKAAVPEIKNKTIVKNKPVDSFILKKKTQNKKVIQSRRSRIDEDSLIPEEFKGLWAKYKSGRPYEVITELQGISPTRAELKAPYHYIYAESYAKLKDKMNAIMQYRLAYISATDDIRELALFKRASLYMDLRFYQEAMADYIVFLREFPDSGRSVRAGLNQAKSKEEMGEYSDAIAGYKKLGSIPEAVFGWANSLQKQGNTKEASRIYERAMLVDDKYIEKSPETRYHFAENLRLMGDIKRSRKEFLKIKSGIYKDRADISLGLIAMKESKYPEAEKRLRDGADSIDSKVKVQALYALSWVLKKTGRMNESISTLERIRHKHPNASLYKNAILELSKNYREKGELNKSVPILKELVYGRTPPREAFNELESILTDASKKEKAGKDEPELISLWKEVGPWLLDERREDFLLSIAGKFKGDKGIFLDITSWIVKNGSKEGKEKAAVELADYFAAIGNAEVSREYLDIAKGADGLKDRMLLIEAKIEHISGNNDTAFSRFRMAEKFEDNDLKLLGGIIDGLKAKQSSEFTGAVAFYETILNQTERGADLYTKLADLLFVEKEYKQAMKYYSIAYKKKPEDEWVAYRIGKGSGRDKSEEMFAKLEKGSSLVSRVAKMKLMEFNLIDKVEEVY